MKPGVPLGRIVRLFHRYRRLMAGLLALVVLASALGVVAPFLLRAILDRALPARDAGLVTVLALGMIASSVTAGVLAVTTNRLAQVVGQRVMHDLRAAAGGRQGGVAAMTADLGESLAVAGVLLAKTMGLQDELRRRFAARSREISDLELAGAMAGRWRTASRRIALTVVPAIVYWLA